MKNEELLEKSKTELGELMAHVMLIEGIIVTALELKPEDIDKCLNNFRKEINKRREN